MSILADHAKIIETTIIAILSFIIADYGIDFKKPYPLLTIAYFDEPLVRFMSYVFIYLVAAMSNSVSVLLAISILFLHIDHINLARKAIF
jgi:hypothetical protein